MAAPPVPTCQPSVGIVLYSCMQCRLCLSTSQEGFFPAPGSPSCIQQLLKRGHGCASCSASPYPQQQQQQHQQQDQHHHHRHNIPVPSDSADTPVQSRGNNTPILSSSTTTTTTPQSSISSRIRSSHRSSNKSSNNAPWEAFVLTLWER